jgi:SAM-dependent methyltransferase
VIARHGAAIYEVDYSRAMLEYCRRNASGYRPFLAAASAFQLPFPDRAFDTVVSIRLSHHIPARDGRHQHVRELCRTSRRHVLVTFFGEETLKNRLRELRSLLGSPKRSKYTLRRTEVESLAKECGFRVVRFWSLSRLFSGHYYALLERA